jgi:streptogramin lyase
MIRFRNTFIAGGIAFAAILFVTSAANAATIRIRRTTTPTPRFTVYPRGGNALLGVTAGPDGNVWLTSDGPLEHPGASSGVAKITSQGQVTYYGTGPADSSYPFAIVTGGDGNLWFTDIGNEFIYRMTPQGTILGTYNVGLTGTDVPAGLTVAPDGSLYYVSSWPGLYVGHVDLFGNITEIAHLRSDLVADPSIAYSGGNLYFTAQSLHTGDQVLVTIAPTGKPSFLHTGLKGSRSQCCAVESPQSIATASDGSVWFTNARYVDRKGYQPLGHVTADGLHFYNTPIPWLGTVVAGPDGDMWVAGEDPTFKQGMLGAVGPNGASKAWPLPSATSAYAITVGPDGNLWMSGANETSGSVIIKATP